MNLQEKLRAREDHAKLQEEIAQQKEAAQRRVLGAEHPDALRALPAAELTPLLRPNIALRFPVPSLPPFRWTPATTSGASLRVGLGRARPRRRPGGHPSASTRHRPGRLGPCGTTGFPRRRPVPSTPSAASCTMRTSVQPHGDLRLRRGRSAAPHTQC